MWVTEIISRWWNVWYSFLWQALLGKILARGFFCEFFENNLDSLMVFWRNAKFWTTWPYWRSLPVIPLLLNDWFNVVIWKLEECFLSLSSFTRSLLFPFIRNSQSIYTIIYGIEPRICSCLTWSKFWPYQCWILCIMWTVYFLFFFMHSRT